MSVLLDTSKTEEGKERWNEARWGKAKQRWGRDNFKIILKYLSTRIWNISWYQYLIITGLLVGGLSSTFICRVLILNSPFCSLLKLAFLPRHCQPWELFKQTSSCRLEQRHKVSWIMKPVILAFQLLLSYLFVYLFFSWSERKIMWKVITK